MKKIKKQLSPAAFYTFFTVLVITIIYKCFIVFSYMSAGDDADSAVATDLFFIVFMLVPMLLSAAATIISSARGRKFYCVYTIVLLMIVCVMSLLEFVPYIYRFMLVFSSIAAQGAAAGLIYDTVRAIKRKRAAAYIKSGGGKNR